MKRSNFNFTCTTSNIFIPVLCFILVKGIFSPTVAQIQSIYITNQADSVSIYDGNTLIAKLIWPDNPINGQNDTIDVSVNSTNLLPPSAGGFNYGLNSPIHFSLRNLASISFSHSVILRQYVDTTLFKLDEIISHTNIYKIIDGDTIFNKINWTDPYHGVDFVECEIYNIFNNENYLVVGFNLLFGEFNAPQLTEPFSEEVLVPLNKELILNEGVSLYSNNYSNLIVRGKLRCNGSELQTINFNDINLVIWGIIDSSFANNELQLYCINTNLMYVSQYYCNSIVEHCSLLTITVSKYSTSRVLNSFLTYVQFDHSKGLVDNCYFGSSYFADSGNSIFEIKNSFFEHITNDIEFHHCLVNLNNNTIYADVSNLMIFYNSLAIIEHNYITSTDDECYNDGISVGSFAIISSNIFRGKFRAVLRCDYGDTLVAYNNTFLEGCGGFSTASHFNNRMSFYNNIFFMQSGWDINLDYNTFGQGQNITYVDSNLSYRGDPYLTYFINNPQDSSIVYGNAYPLVSDPNFLDTNSCYLQSNSPAIDRGLTKIYSFGTQFSVLDTTVIIPDSITITSYYGLRPDLGAREYDPTVLVENLAGDNIPVSFTLSQNYPNPFNSSTLIRYSIPHLSVVSIKLYNTLGELVNTIVDEEKMPGEYEIEVNAVNLPSGIYFYRINTENFSQTKKMVLLK